MKSTERTHEVVWRAVAAGENAIESYSTRRASAARHPGDIWLLTFLPRCLPRTGEDPARLSIALDVEATQSDFEEVSTDRHAS